MTFTPITDPWFYFAAVPACVAAGRQQERLRRRLRLARGADDGADGQRAAGGGDLHAAAARDGPARHGGVPQGCGLDAAAAAAAGGAGRDRDRGAVVPRARRAPGRGRGRRTHAAVPGAAPAVSAARRSQAAAALARPAAERDLGLHELRRACGRPADQRLRDPAQAQAGRLHRHHGLPVLRRQPQQVAALCLAGLLDWRNLATSILLLPLARWESGSACAWRAGYRRCCSTAWSMSACS